MTDIDFPTLLTAASNDADFYETIVVNWNGIVGTTSNDLYSDEAYVDDADSTEYTYRLNSPYTAARTVEHLTTFPAASGPLTRKTVADLIARVGALEPGELYALATVDTSSWPRDENGDPVTIGFLTILSVISADDVTWTASASVAPTR